MGKSLYPGPARWVWVAFFVVITSALLAGGYAYYHSETDRIRKGKYEDLAAIAELKAGQIREWRRERLADIGSLSRSPLFKRTFGEWLRDRKNEVLLADLKDKLVVEQRTGGYTDAILLSPDGHILLSAQPQRDPLSPVAKVAIEEALANRSPVLSDLYRNPQGTVLIDAVAPILDPKGQPIAVGLFRSNAESLLYPLIQSWPGSSRTAETLLIRKDCDGVLFLNDLRHRPNTALSLREPLTLTDLPGVQAVLGKQGMFQGRDYRGVDVLADLRPVPDSPWFMVAKVDASEILSEARYRGGVTALFAGLFILLAAGVTAYGYRHRQARLYQELYRSEREQREAQEQFRTTLYSIGDAVITTDTRGLVKQMNPVAELLTGWLETEARGKHLDEVFHIVNEDSRELVENPVQRVLREGQVVGLANHTLLIAKDGTEYAIADSGAPIRDETGAITGVVLVFRDQTQERMAQQALREKEESFRSIVEGAPDAVFVQTGGLFAYLNGPALRLFGADSPEDLLGKPVMDRFHPRFHETVRERIRLLNVEKKPVLPLEEIWLRVDGAEVSVDVSAVPIYFHGRDGALVFARDITDRKKGEKALRESEERLRLALLESRQGFYDLNVVTGKAVVSPEYALMLGYDSSEFEETYQKWLDRLHPDDRDRVAAFYRSYIAGEVEDYQVEFRQRTKSGDWKWIFSVGNVVEKNIDGTPVRMVGTHLDITARKLAEDELHQKTEVLSSVFQASPLAIIALDREGIVTMWNPAAERMFGWTEKEALGCLNPVVPEEKQDEFGRLRESVLRGESFSGVELTRRKRDGTAVEISLSTAPLGGPDGKIVGILSVSADITNRKRAEEVQRRLATAVEQSIESVMITDRSGNIEYVNPAFESISGYSSEEVVGHKPRFLKSDQHGNAFYKDMAATVGSGKPWKGRIVSKRKDGKLYHEDVTISPVRNSAGQIVNYVDVGHDVTQQVQLEKQLVQAQKMEAIGTLAGGIAHDFNNLLQIIIGYSELVLLDQTEKDRRYQELQAIRQAATRGADLVRQILTFSRRVETNPRPINLNAEVKQAQKLLARTIPKMIDIQLLLADDLKTINADSGQIEQILLNLAVNAQHAMPEGGKIVIQTENVILDAEYCETHLDVKPGEYALLTVSDTGHGMEKEVIDHIFEPFYSTKTPGEGTGLGLAMVFGIVKGHGGHVECYSEPSEGTTFRIYLPALVAVERSDVETSQEMPAFGTETILLVDDEALIMELGKRILSRAGYTVLTASNGKEALDIYESRKSEIALVILDLIMPEMGGIECLKEILRIDPEARVLIASGYSAESLPRETTEGGAVGFIGKPYKMKEMLRVVRKVLDVER